MSTDLQPQQTALAEAVEPRVPNLATDPTAFLTDAGAFNHLWRVATGYSRSKLVPMAFQGKIDDCFIICQLAIRMRVDPFMLMQATYVVHGRPGFEAKLAIALLNASGKIRGTLKTNFGGDGDDYGCQAVAVDSQSGETITGPRITWRIVKAERWNAKDGSKWLTMPEMMFIYRAASWFIRANYPEVLMGMQTLEEVEDVAHAGPVQLTTQSRLETLISSAGNPDGGRVAPPIDAKSEAAEPPKPKRGRPAKVPAPAAAVVEHNADPLAAVTESSEFADLRNEYQQRMDACKTFLAAAELVHQVFTDPAVLALPTHQHEAIQAACVSRRKELAAPGQTSLLK
jgi:hypothetical protein